MGDRQDIQTDQIQTEQEGSGIDASEMESEETTPENQAEIQGLKFQMLADSVQQLSEMVEGILPVIARLVTSEKEQREKSATPEGSNKMPWDKRRPSPTFTEYAGSLAFESPELHTKDRAKRRRQCSTSRIGWRKRLELQLSENSPTFHGETSFSGI